MGNASANACLFLLLFLLVTSFGCQSPPDAAKAGVKPYAGMEGRPLGEAKAEIEKLNLELKAAGATWTAAVTPISLLSKPAFLTLLGARRTPPQLLRRQAKASEALFKELTKRDDPPPAAWDWRSISGKNWLTPVRNQKQCGSCWAFATVAAVEASLKIGSGDPTWNPDLSEQMLVSCSGSGDCNGGYSDDVFIRDNGVPPESSFPYKAKNLLCSDRPADWASKAVKVDGWIHLEYPTVEETKQAVMQGPVYTTFEVYSDFYAYGGGVYQHSSGNLLGGHAVLLVGWDDQLQAWIVKNSWGGWGENGYFRIAYESKCGFGEEIHLPLYSGFYPRTVSVDTDNDEHSVKVEFNLPLDPVTAADAANYAIDGVGLAASADLSDENKTVTLAFDAPPPDGDYVATLDLSDIQSADGESLSDSHNHWSGLYGKRLLHWQFDPDDFVGPEDNPVFYDGNLFVNSGEVTFLPGTSFHAADSPDPTVYLTNSATLNSEGTAELPISFSNMGQPPAVRFWTVVWGENSSATLNLSHTTLGAAEIGVYINGPTDDEKWETEGQVSVVAHHNDFTGAAQSICWFYEKGHTFLTALYNHFEGGSDEPVLLVHQEDGHDGTADIEFVGNNIVGQPAFKFEVADVEALTLQLHHNYLEGVDEVISGDVPPQAVLPALTNPIDLDFVPEQWLFMNAAYTTPSSWVAEGLPVPLAALGGANENGVTNSYPVRLQTVGSPSDSIIVELAQPPGQEGQYHVLHGSLATETDQLGHTLAATAGSAIQARSLLDDSVLDTADVGENCDDDDVCTSDSWNAGGDQCVHLLIDPCCGDGVCDPAEVCGCMDCDGEPCDDGDSCTLVDVCQELDCKGTEPVTCEAHDQCHEVGVCNPSSGVCSNPARPDGAPCSDGTLCTKVDSCFDGACVGGAPVTCLPLNQCHEAGMCDPDTGLCSDPPKGNGVPCDDGTLCTKDDSCQGGVCTGADPVVCAALSQCHDAGACEPATGACLDPPKADGHWCSDNDACTVDDFCFGGSCLPGAPICECQNSADCKQQEDDDLCNGTLICDTDQFPFECAVDQETVVICDGSDNTHCRKAQCHPETGECTLVNEPDGAPCSDDDLCTIGDACQEGECATALDLCQCRTDEDCLPFEDGNLCNGHLYCAVEKFPYECLVAPASMVVCDQSLNTQCTAQQCVPETGACVTVPSNEALPCDDGDLCTQTDLCTEGACVGADPVDCAHVDPCLDAGQCDPASGLCFAPAVPDGTECDDGVFCTVGDACYAGECAPGPGQDCSASADECNAGECNEQAQTCLPAPLPLGTPCGAPRQCVDGILTLGDQCDGQGQCHGQGTGSCAPYAGCADGQHCADSCEQNADCAFAHVCVDAGCKPDSSPVADAGGDLTAYSGELVQLDGSGSYDPDGGELTYYWTQKEGPHAELDAADTALPQFSAPATEIDAQCVFHLTVEDGFLSSKPDEVIVTVYPLPDNAEEDRIEPSPEPSLDVVEQAGEDAAAPDTVIFPPDVVEEPPSGAASSGCGTADTPGDPVPHLLLLALLMLGLALSGRRRDNMRATTETAPVMFGSFLFALFLLQFLTLGRTGCRSIRAGDLRH